MEKDTRNVINYYKYWETEAIKADLDTKRNNFSVLISNEFNDFNCGSVIRNANAFLAKEVIIYGRKHFDRRGAVGCTHYENMKHVRKMEELSFPSDSIIIGVDNIESAVPIETFIWPTNHVVLVFGLEDIGITEDLKAICSQFVYIKQYGSVRSLNVGCASAITMYDYCNKMVK